MRISDWSSGVCSSDLERLDPIGEGEPERGSPQVIGIHTHPSTVLVNDALGDRQPDAGAGVLVGGVEALEHAEDPLPVLLLDADPVVDDLDAPTVAVLHPARGDLDAHRRVGASELHGVAPPVLHHTGQLGDRTPDRWPPAAPALAPLLL